MFLNFHGQELQNKFFLKNSPSGDPAWQFIYTQLWKRHGYYITLRKTRMPCHIFNLGSDYQQNDLGHVTHFMLAWKQNYAGMQNRCQTLAYAMSHFNSGIEHSTKGKEMGRSQDRSDCLANTSETLPLHYRGSLGKADLIIIIPHFLSSQYLTGTSKQRKMGQIDFDMGTISIGVVGLTGWDQSITNYFQFSRHYLKLLDMAPSTGFTV